ncbi:hypothetical protein FGD77_16910 [Roseovarius sp. M141]|nr:hypothetical protein [Roseovarius sp. M141]
MGAGTRGVEPASQRYFDESAVDLGPADAAMLAGLPTAPSYLPQLRT